ncbi:sce7725 family protein [Paenibacillus alkalitolerans]|uniref:sce7725 family protein n=1 Tax=Paenibacillus alkalitolerans TaxID=2799335 RepID=UPI0018F75804|nr:sce7725 family protein [Paenibacillus alkalitolerans]
MYFPFLRGRQFELIAIRELIEKSLINRSVMPIVEPVKLSAALIKTLVSFRESDRALGLVRNPQVGSMLKDLADEKNKKDKDRFLELLNTSDILSFLYSNAKLPTHLSSFERQGITKQDIATICINQDAIPHFESVYATDIPRLNFIRDESVYRRRMPNQRVLFEDRFPKRNRNVDYLEQEDESFTSDHLYYKQDGYLGFSDFSVVGDEYSETGFAPYAIAIHIVYFADDQALRVRHFVADTNDDITDPAGKFAEALEKLVAWNEINKLDTFGIKTFEEIYRNRSYPGLGTVKKLSIMHHLELMSRYLDGVK